MNLRRQSNCFQRSHSTIAVAFFQKYKSISLGSAWVLLASLEEGIMEFISLAVGKSNRRADIFKNCHVCQTELRKMENYAISNFLQICYCFSLKANSTYLSLLAHIDFWQDYSIPPQHIQPKEPHPCGSIMHGKWLTISVLFILL